jgi:hypothetical protein
MFDPSTDGLKLVPFDVKASPFSPEFDPSTDGLKPVPFDVKASPFSPEFECSTDGLKPVPFNAKAVFEGAGLQPRRQALPK